MRIETPFGEVKGRDPNIGDAAGGIGPVGLALGGYVDSVRSANGASIPGIDYQAVSDRNAASRTADIAAGRAEGRRLFYDDPDMQSIRSRLTDLSKGYNGQELGALKGLAQSDLQNNRSQYLRQLSSKAARGGVGGARGAALQASADQGFQKTRSENERKILLDNSNLVRKGTDDLNNFLMRQRFGELGTSLGYGQLGVSDRAGVMGAQAAEQAARVANQPSKKGLLGSLFEGIL